MKAKKNKRQRSEQVQQVSAALGDLLGMTQWRKEHPQATWAKIEAVVDEQMNQVRAQVLQELVQMGESEDWRKLPAQKRPRCATCGGRSRRVESRRATSKRLAGKPSS